MSSSDMSPFVVAIDHPSLHHLVAPFVEVLRSEPRRFGRDGACNPKPFPSLVRKVTDASRRRFGTMLDGDLTGMASLSSDGQVALAIAAPYRGKGLGTLLLEHVALTAERDGYSRLIMESTRRSQPVAQLGERFGWTACEQERGRVELMLRFPVDLTG